MRIYVASSWRNELQPVVVRALRDLGHTVYDYRNPRHPHQEGGGFAWSDIDPNWQSWTAQQQIESLDHEIARSGFGADMHALHLADVCIMVQPCGRSAALELGFAVGSGKPCAVLMADGQEPELMLRMAHKLTTSLEGLLVWVAVIAKKVAERKASPANLPGSNDELLRVYERQLERMDVMLQQSLTDNRKLLEQLEAERDHNLREIVRLDGTVADLRERERKLLEGTAGGSTGELAAGTAA